MKNRIIEITSDGRYLRAHRGFLVIQHGDVEQARVPIDDIAAVIGNAHGLVWSNELLVRLAERGAPLVLVNKKHQPVAMLLALEGHHRQGARMVQQAALSTATRKRLWKHLVQAKLRAQARTLAAFGHAAMPLRRLADGVRANDPDNREAQGARIYWPLLMGADFRRDPDLEGANALLNFGYTIFRTAVMRAIVCAGLHPTLGLKHCSEFNAAALADDLIEPFRPLVDACVVSLMAAGICEVNPDSKKRLALCLYLDIPTQAGFSPINTAIERLAFSLAQVCEGKARQLELPGELSPAALRALGAPPEARHTNASEGDA